MIKLLVVADDFTGALDTGVQFSKEGIRTFVASNVEIDFFGIDESIQVLSVNTETRHKSKEEAYEIVYKLVKKASGLGVKHIYKKTDSTLRGNIGCELLAALDGTGKEKLMFIPAFPDNGRTTENGVQCIDGIPIAQTHFARDPFNPVTESYIPDIIKQQANTETVVVKKDESAEYSGNRCIYIFDAKTNNEMIKIGSELKKSGQISLMAGCAGFAGALQNIIEFEKNTRTAFPRGKNILLVSGSVNNTSLEQLRTAKEFGFKGIKLNPEQKLNRDYYESIHCDALADEIRNILSINKMAYIEAVECAEDMEQCRRYAMEKNLNVDKLHLLIAKNIGEIIKKIVNTCEVSNLIVFGGDTLLGIMENLGIRGVIPVTEICSGVVASKIISDKYSFNIITKAGGLGNKDAVVTVAENLLYVNPHLKSAF